MEEVDGAAKKKSNNTLFIVIGGIVSLLFVFVCCMGLLVFMVMSSLDEGTISDFIDDMSTLVTVQQELLAEYPADNIQITIVNNTTLRVEMTNPQFEMGEPVEKAREIATFTRQNSTELSGITDITIGFSQQSGNVVAFSRMQFYSFSVSELE
ncbi:MAG TPA: hypothetical protein VLL52_06685 [Anaerolineae bacterium]|nr:hypothetical protein [Anaerolineae bacterium]